MDMESSPMKQVSFPMMPGMMPKRARLQAALIFSPPPQVAIGSGSSLPSGSLLDFRTRAPKRTRGYENDDDDEMGDASASHSGQQPGNHLSKRTRRRLPAMNDEFHPKAAWGHNNNSNASSASSAAGHTHHAANTAAAAAASSHAPSHSAYANTNEMLRSLHEARMARAQQSPAKAQLKSGVVVRLKQDVDYYHQQNKQQQLYWKYSKQHKQGSPGNN
jgi:hypothetical protein